jgi:hypothetical protein
MAWTTPATVVVGQIMTAATWNAQVRDNLSFLGQVPRAQAYQTAAQSLPNNAATSVLFDSEVYDSDNIHSTATNTSRFTIATPGLYQCSYTVHFAANATGLRFARWFRNGVAATAVNGTPNGQTSIAQTKSFSCIAGDYLEVQMQQASGAALNTQSSGGYVCEAEVLWVATS